MYGLRRLRNSIINRGHALTQAYFCELYQSGQRAGKKSCAVACIGCGLCVKACPFEAITLKNNLAYIDHEKCRLCRKCAPVCPTHAIVEMNLPELKAASEPAGVKSSA